MKKGFALIELLVVVLIIGVLSAVALPQYTKAVRRARVTELWSYCKAFSDAQRVYYLANGKYTTDLDNLDIQLPELGDFELVIGSEESTRSSMSFRGKNLMESLIFFFSMSIGTGGAEGRSFSCYEVSSSNSTRCLSLMPCSSPTLLGGSAAACYF